MINALVTGGAGLEVILGYLGASDEEVKDVQLRMGRVWR